MVRGAIEVPKSAVVGRTAGNCWPGTRDAANAPAGGGMEQGEMALTAACRELAEELGTKVYRAERFISYTNWSPRHDATFISSMDWG